MVLDGQPLTLDGIASVARGGEAVTLSGAAADRIRASRRLVEQIVAEHRVVYGINTGFGKLADVHIPETELRELQVNLVRSHSCGLGEPLPEAETRAVMLLRANVLAKGLSGVRIEVVDTLLALLNRRVHPVIPSKGSVGASGDLAPLAHLALAMIGEGEAVYERERLPSDEALRRAGVGVLSLEAKEGLALLNGTQAMAAVGALALHRGLRLVRLADVAGAMTLEALRGTPVAFDARIHAARPHAGQMESAGRLRGLLEGSEIRASHLSNDPRVQDAYSLRCMPQVHGAVLDALSHAAGKVEIESGSATDNPLVFPGMFPEDGQVLSGGNFHGAPLAGAFDYAAIALTSLAAICERRIDRLVNPDLNEGLPAFLTTDPGTRSGYMIAQISAAALLNECRVLAHPASTDNVPTSGGKEDHVSMGMTAALKLRSIVENVTHILAIEMMCAAQGLDYRAPLRPGAGVAVAHARIRGLVAPLEGDRVAAGDVRRIAAAIEAGVFDANPPGPW
jgi:histidine ammonia-lyase